MNKELEANQIISHYRIISKIGAGGWAKFIKFLLADMVTAFTKPLYDLAIANAQKRRQTAAIVGGTIVYRK